MMGKILCVDDDFNAVQGYKRLLHNEFSVEISMDAPKGLEILRERGPFAVVVSDLRMPGMDGIHFLAAVREHAPETVRILLTGHADLDNAIAAVNEGNIFRFLTKPCSLDTLRKALYAAIEQYNLIVAERVLLKRTLVGSIKVLTEILETVNPVAFSRASRIKPYVRHLAAQLKVRDAWQVELAAMLSQIGCVTLAPDLLNKVDAGQELTADEQKIFANHPKIAGSFLAKIPRLESVAQMIEWQQQIPAEKRNPVDKAHPDYQVFLGAHLLKAALDFDQLVTHGMAARAAVEALGKRGESFLPGILDALQSLEVEKRAGVVKTVTMSELAPLMVLDEDVKAKDGTVLLTKGQEITASTLESLHNLANTSGVVEPIRVTVPHDKAPPAAVAGDSAS